MLIILFNNKTKIKWERDNLIKRKKKTNPKLNYLQIKRWKNNRKKSNFIFLKTDSSQHAKFAALLWGLNNPVQKKIMEVNF